MPDWKSELKKVADLVADCIRRDPYPEEIFPVPLRDAVRAYPLAGGKRLRPALLMWSCGMFGGDPLAVLPAAAAVEVYHNWTLVHDDIIDCDDLRRGKPTAHAALSAHASALYGTGPEASRKFGCDFAILAGDLQQAWACRFLLRLKETGTKPELILFLLEKMQDDLARSLISGEALDVEFAPRGFRRISARDVREMIAGKTGAILRYSMQAGAVLASGTPSFDTEELRRIAEYADELALAFQLQDDYLGVFGTESEFGKPLCSDFHESKPTILYLNALESADPAQRERLPSLMGLESYPPDVQAEIRTLLVETGAAAKTRNEILSRSEHALRLLRRFPENEYRVYLENLTQYLIERTV